MQISEYDFDVIKVFKAGFSRINGIKQPFVLAFLAYIIIAILLQTILGLFFPSTPENPSVINQQIVVILSYPALVPILVGIMMMAIENGRDSNKALELKEIFSYYAFAGTLSMASLLMYMITMFIPIMILLFPESIIALADGTLGSFAMIVVLFLLLAVVMYLSIAYIFTLPLIVDKGLGAWEAMELSRKAVSVRFGKITWIVTLLSIVAFGGVLSFGIGLIWAIPLFFVTMYGMLYNNIFEEEA